jgi:hypothetical protein
MLRLVMNKGKSGPSLRLGVLLAATIMLVSASSGCINASWTKDLLNPDKPNTVYKVKEKIIQKHYFQTIITDSSSFESIKENTTNIKDATQWMKVSVKVSLDQPYPALLPIIQQIEDRLGLNITRSVHIVITMPDGTKWYERNFNETGNDTLVIQSPESGTWDFKTQAYGVGSDQLSFHDGYTVIATAFEPTRE